VPLLTPASEGKSTCLIALFVYKRTVHTARTISALSKCPEASSSDLVVYSDGPRSEADSAAVHATRAIVRSVQGFRSLRVVEREKNLGLASNIVSGVTESFAHADRLIVLEDDIEVSPNFLAFMRAALDHYESRHDVWSISGYMYPVSLDPAYQFDSLLFSRFSCWGWATWRDRWHRVEWKKPDRGTFMGSRDAFWNFWKAANDLPEIMLDLIDGRNDSWSILFNYSQIGSQGFSVHPVRSLVRNIGFDETGTHTRRAQKSRKQVSPVEGTGRADHFGFADAYDELCTEPLRKFFSNRIPRKLKNLVRYGRYF